MSCNYCEYPDERALSMGVKDEGFERGSRISYDFKNDTFSIYTTESNLNGFEIHKISDVKYCPCCGSKLKKPNAKTVEDNKRWEKDFEERRQEHAKKEKKREREHAKWLEREYEKNPYDPTKPRLKNKNFRNAVKYFAKYMGITEFYWDDEYRRLVGWNGGYIDFSDKAIGPCYETNGVMETFHESGGRTYSVEELCEGYKKSEED